MRIIRKHMDIYCKVTPLGLVPLYDSDHEEKKRLREGDVVKCKVTRPRNYKFHKKFFALVRLTFDNLPESICNALGVRNEDDMLRLIKYDLGLFDVFQVGDKTVVSLNSISFAAMDNTEFEKFYNRTIDLVLSKYLRGNTREELIEEITHFQ